MLHALSHYPDHRLPELFAGYSTTEAPIPVEYPTANRPQAWASGTIFLLLTCMAGMDMMTWRLDGAPYLPAGTQRLRLDGIISGHAPARVELSRDDHNGIARSVEAERNSAVEREGPRLLSPEEADEIVA